MPATNAIETHGLVKAFATTRAVDGVSLRIRKGSVYGLLGPNGAGKTTTIRMLATLLKPTEGTATVLGHDVVADAAMVRRKISLTGQFASVDDELTGHENLVMVGRLLGLAWGTSRERATELLEAFGLAEAAQKQAREYSGGMRRKLDIAASLVATPEVLFLDEPTAGLDPRSRNQVWDIVRAIAAEGTTVLLTTQYLEEADRLADRMAVIDKGKVIAEGTSRDLKASVGSSTLHVRLRTASHRAKARKVLAEVLPNPITNGADAGTLAVHVQDELLVAEALAALAKAKLPVAEFNLGSPSLDEVFFALTGRPAEPAAEPKGAKA
jgi:ABC-2 type transport system ATP-binding protein